MYVCILAHLQFCRIIGFALAIIILIEIFALFQTKGNNSRTCKPYTISFAIVQEMTTRRIRLNHRRGCKRYGHKLKMTRGTRT